MQKFVGTSKQMQIAFEAVQTFLCTFNAFERLQQFHWCDFSKGKTFQYFCILCHGYNGQGVCNLAQWLKTQNLTLNWPSAGVGTFQSLGILTFECVWKHKAINFWNKLWLALSHWMTEVSVFAFPLFTKFLINSAKIRACSENQVIVHYAIYEKTIVVFATHTQQLALSQHNKPN